jgi:uncharacterized protein (DUF1330 family)
MAAYLIADVDITDAALSDEYRREFPAIEKWYGCRYWGRGGLTKCWKAIGSRIVSSSSSPDMAPLIIWNNSREYSRLKAIRERCAKTRIIALEGVVTPILL